MGEISAAHFIDGDDSTTREDELLVVVGFLVHDGHSQHFFSGLVRSRVEVVDEWEEANIVLHVVGQNGGEGMDAQGGETLCAGMA